MFVQPKWTNIYVDQLWGQVKITRDIYESKVLRWASEWPQLTVIPWDATEPQT